MTTPSEAQYSFGPIRLTPGVRPRQIGIFLVVACIAICTLSFIPLMQAFVFSEMLRIPRTEQGRLAGNLTTLQQIAVLLFLPLWGALADRLGRKQVMVFALLIYSASLFAYPLAGGAMALFAVQFVFGIAWSAHTAGGATMMVDYPSDASRGRFTGMMIAAQGMAGAVIVGFVGSRLPGWLVDSGVDAKLAGRYAFWAAAALGLVGAAIAWRFLKEVPRSSPPEARAGLRGSLRAFGHDFRRVAAHGRQNPRFALVLLMGFVLRSDYVVILSFLSLWVMNGAAAHGVSSIDSLKMAGTLIAIFKVSTLTAPLLFGFVADRVPRTVLLVVSLIATGLALCSTGLVTDVMGLGICIVVAIIGVTESAMIIAAQSVFGDEAPAELRGSAMSIFSATGVVSIIVVSFVGGHLFDAIGFTAPFVLVGAMNLVFGVAGIGLLYRQRDTSAEHDPAPSGRMPLGKRLH